MSSKRQCVNALELHEKELSNYKNVVGIGIIQLDEESKEGKTVENAIAVYVRKKVPKNQLSPDDLIPQHLVIKRGCEVPVKVIEQGKVTLESPDSFGKEPL